MTFSNISTDMPLSSLLLRAYLERGGIVGDPEAVEAVAEERGRDDGERGREVVDVVGSVFILVALLVAAAAAGSFCGGLFPYRVCALAGSSGLVLRMRWQGIGSAAEEGRRRNNSGNNFLLVVSSQNDATFPLFFCPRPLFKIAFEEEKHSLSSTLVDS